MINLLPAAYKKSLEREYMLRVFTVLLMLFGVTGGIALIFVIPAYINATLKEQTLTLQLETLKKSQVIDKNDSLNQIIQDINKKLKIFPDSDTKSPISKSIINSIVADKGTGIVISQINYSKTQDGVTMVNIIGSAKDRDTLLAFQKVLEGEPQFKNITVPISNFIKESNLEFSITFSAI